MKKKHTKKSAEIADSQTETTNPLTNLATEVFGINKPQKKMVDKAIEKTGIKSDVVSDTIDLKQEVLADTEKKSLLGKTMAGLTTLAGTFFAKNILSKKEIETVSGTTSTAVEVYTNEEALKKFNDNFEAVEKVKKEHAEKLQLENPQISKNEAIKKAEEKFDILEEKYAGKDKNIFSVFKNAWSETATDKKGETRSWFGRAFAFLPALFKESASFKLAKKLAKNNYFEKKRALKERGEELKAESEKMLAKGKAAGKVAGEKVSQAKKVSQAAKKSGTIAALKLLKQNNAIGSKYISQAESLIKQLEKGRISPTEFAKNISKNYEKAMGKLASDLRHGKIKPPKFANVAEALKNDTFTLAAKNRKTQEAFLKLSQKGKITGMPIKKGIGKISKIPVGAVGIASAINISIIEAIQAGEFSKFFESLTSKETLSEAFIPGVGTWNSIQRAQNTDDPTWLKAVDVGINVIGDAFLVAGYIGSVVSFGATGAGAVALRGGISGVSRKIISRQSLKYAAQAAKKSTAKAIKVSAFSSPFTVGLSLLAKKFSKKDVEETTMKIYTENVETPEQKRLRKNLSANSIEGDGTGNTEVMREAA